MQFGAGNDVCVGLYTGVGVQYQHLSYDKQLAWKTRQVGELMKHMAAITFPVNDCLSSAQTWNYRSKITPHFQKPEHGKIGPIGFLIEGRRQQVLDVPRCPIASDSINRTLENVRREIVRTPFGDPSCPLTFG